MALVNSATADVGCGHLLGAASSFPSAVSQKGDRWPTWRPLHAVLHHGAPALQCPAGSPPLRRTPARPICALTPGGHASSPRVCLPAVTCPLPSQCVSAGCHVCPPALTCVSTVTCPLPSQCVSAGCHVCVHRLSCVCPPALTCVFAITCPLPQSVCVCRLSGP